MPKPICSISRPGRSRKIASGNWLTARRSASQRPPAPIRLDPCLSANPVKEDTIVRVADRLSVARQRQFVGREDELALFDTALNAAELPFCVLYIYGPGGVGKSTLLQTLLGR